MSGICPTSSQVGPQWDERPCRASRCSLTEREVENLSAGIQELNLKCAVGNWEALLPNELIHAGFANFAGAVRPRVNSVVVAGGGAVERELEPNRLAVLRRSQNEVQVAGVETEH